MTFDLSEEAENHLGHEPPFSLSLCVCLRANGGGSHTDGRAAGGSSSEGVGSKSGPSGAESSSGGGASASHAAAGGRRRGRDRQPRSVFIQSVSFDSKVLSFGLVLV